MNSSLQDREYRPWLMLAMAAPAAQAAAVCAWPSVLLTGALCLGLCAGMPECEIPRWMAILRWAVLAVLSAVCMKWSGACWQDAGENWIMPLVLLLLAAYAARNGAQKASAASNVLRYGTWGVVLALLLTGVGEMKIEYLQPKWKMETAELITVLLLPVIGGGGKRNGGTIAKLMLLVVSVSIVTEGVMGRRADFMGLTRSLNVFGIAQRMESLAAAALTISWFALLSFFLVSAGENWSHFVPGKERDGGILCALCAAALYFWRVDTKSYIPALLILAVWVILPLLEKIHRKLKNCEKSA